MGVCCAQAIVSDSKVKYEEKFESSICKPDPVDERSQNPVPRLDGSPTEFEDRARSINPDCGYAKEVTAKLGPFRYDSCRDEGLMLKEPQTLDEGSVYFGFWYWREFS